VDWRLFRNIYDVSLDHHWVGSFFNGVEKASIPVMVIATVALWLFARPGSDRKWKLTAASGLAAAVIALVVDTVIHTIHDRARPYEAHAFSHPWAASTDASFPSDHASASLAIAFAILAFDLPVGVVFVVAAALIAVGRIFVGAHYPGDVLASLVVALVSALVAVRFLRPLLDRLVRLVERATDPVLGRVYPKRPVT
jgi:undecaprenyl-diphosphatase